MAPSQHVSLSRRSLIGLGLGTTLLAACRRVTGSGDPILQAPPKVGPAPSTSVSIAPTPTADDGHSMPEVAGVCAPTDRNIEGPFFKAGAPYQSVLVGESDAGQRLMLSGKVLSTDCRPIEGVDMDIWQADAAGVYDLDGYRYRGRLRTTGEGGFQIATVVPGRYLNGKRYRPSHIHVKLRAPGHHPLTTQLYFDGDPYNQGDDFFLSSLVMDAQRAGAAIAARFAFVLQPASG